MKGSVRGAFIALLGVAAVVGITVAIGLWGSAGMSLVVGSRAARRQRRHLAQRCPPAVPSRRRNSYRSGKKSYVPLEAQRHGPKQTRHGLS